MNTDFYENIDTNFEQAFIMCERDFSHEELISMLKTGNIPEKQIAALKLDDIYNETEARVLINNLTGCDGKIREAVALKINQILISKPAHRSFFSDKFFARIFADATIDINANICRLVISSASMLSEYSNFMEEYAQIIIKYTVEALDELDKFIFRDKKYVINKQFFKLYWCLESLKVIYAFIDRVLFINLLDRAYIQKEYTIREKVAELVVLSKFKELEKLKLLLEKDDNYYVRNIFMSS